MIIPPKYSEKGMLSKFLNYIKHKITYSDNSCHLNVIKDPNKTEKARALVPIKIG